jgi:hypothetical protein
LEGKAAERSVEAVVQIATADYVEDVGSSEDIYIGIVALQVFDNGQFVAIADGRGLVPLSKLLKKYG